MGFLSGRVSFVRYRINGPRPGLFGFEHLERLAAHAIGRNPTADQGDTQVGWTAGDNLLDLDFGLAKNIVADALHFAIRLDTLKMPAELLRAYAQAELAVLAAANPSGRPSAFQKKRAKEAARARLEAEAQDGRITRRKAYPVLWDGRSNELLVGTPSAAVLAHMQRLFQETFGHGLVLVDAEAQALRAAAGPENLAAADLRPSSFVAGGPVEVAWVRDPARPSHLGNEFLLWLWFILETEGDTLVLPDGSEVAVLLARTLLMECPKGESGSETIRSVAPTRLPEARRAVQAGKLPRQAGLSLARQCQQYELTLQAELLSVGGDRLPDAEEREPRCQLKERLGQLRQLVETLDLLYDAFLSRRRSASWPRELEQLRGWLQRPDHPGLAAAG